MIEFRLLETIEFEQAVSLADRTFRDAGHTSMGVAFPYVFSPALNQSYGAFDHGKLVSFIGLVPSVIHIGPAEIQAYSIGAVCTDPEHRRKGYANTLLRKIFDHIKKAEASLLFVSGTLPLYLKAGCSFYGRLNKYEIGQEDLTKTDEYSIREFQPYDWFRLRNIGNSRFVHFEQSILDFSLLNQAKGFASIQKMEQRIFVAESGNRMKGFAVIGVPSPLSQSPARVIEWGGDEKAVYSILSESLAQIGGTIRFSLPVYETKLNNLLASLPKTETAFPGTAKIVNLDLYLKQLAPFLGEKIEIKDIDKKHKSLRYNQRTILLDNSALEELLLSGAQNEDAFLNEVFPIPLPYPEGLNYV